MANEEHLEVLGRGVEAWNGWRKQHTDIEPDLWEAHLEGVDLRRAHLQHADLRGACLAGADLRAANLSQARLQLADLRGADLRRAYLQDAQMLDADLQRADLRLAYLLGVHLEGTNLHRVQLAGAKLLGASFMATILTDLDLSQAKGLHAVAHRGPSVLSISTLSRSRGRIPEEFLRGCGVADWEIQAARLHDPSLTEAQITNMTCVIDTLRRESPLVLTPLFISYAHPDEGFVDALAPLLDRQRLRYWRDAHDPEERRLGPEIVQAMRLNPTVLLLLSQRSVDSDWVEWEAAKAGDLEEQIGRSVLCPLALDDSWRICSWPRSLREQIESYEVLDFSGWQNPELLAQQTHLLIDRLLEDP